MSLLGLRPPKAEVWTVQGERMVQILLPPGTARETAERAVQQAVQRWVEALDRKQNLKLVSDIEITGPHFCPFLEHEGKAVYGDDMWLAKGRFNSMKPRMVKESVLEGGRRLAEDADVGYFDWRTAQQKAAPDDMAEQLDFVAENADAVYDDLRDLEERKKDAKQKANPLRS